MDHSLKLLDFPRIREYCADYCLSSEGRELMLSSLPSADPEIVARVKREVAIIAAHLEQSELPAFGFPTLGELSGKLGVQGLALNLEEFFALGLWAREYEKLLSWLGRILLKQEASLKSAPGSDSANPHTLWAHAPFGELRAEAPRLQSVVRIVFDLLTPEGELRDLPTLRSIRNAMAKINRDMGAIADSFRSDPELRAALQSDEPTQRDGRTVLAVRANFRGRVKGIVHEVSSSGQTVFVELAPLVEMNNELVQLDARYKAEVARLLREATDELRKHAVAVAGARTSLALLDGRLARAIHCHRDGGVLAESCDSGLTVWRARHPLLGKKAVPIDVCLPENVRTLIITGPNTGGKTVTLKTIGLFALMNQFCLALPAAQGTKFQIFDAVFADIGDEQSIDQSLSTFSGHMKVMSQIVASASSRSLVLLDELGAGTDPEEGCAIAMGLLDHFIDTGSLSIATTHHGILKNYGYTKPGCLNASMEFDPAKFSPTYRIVVGIPGESRALEIAAMIGLDGRIVARAKTYLNEERTDIGELIRGLNEKHRELEKLEAEQRKRIREATEDSRKADLATLRVRQREVELRRHGLSDLSQLLDQSRKTLENLVRELRESGAPTDKTKDVKNFLSELAASVDRQYAVLAEDEKRLASSVETDSVQETMAGSQVLLSEGAEAMYKPFRKRVRLVRALGGERWLVEVGSMRIAANASDLSPAPPKSAAPGSSGIPVFDVELAPRGEDPGSTRASFELDIRGFRLAQALTTVEKQIDAACIQNLSLFSIIHGTGEGVLGKGIQDYLRNHAAVAEYHFARPEEGGYGKTIVRLKS
jgi:DNA mismatch repair protein MutS2